MAWLAILKTLLSIVGYISQYVQEEHLMKAGEARLLQQQLRGINEKLKLVEDARIKSAAGELLSDDGHRRD